MKVLIIDDMLPNALLLQGLVEKISKLNTYVFTNPLEALAWCRDSIPDLVLLDYLMPEMDGITFLKEFRRIRAMEPVPVVVITAEMEKKILYEALDAGATDFLRRPYDVSEFTARVRNMLRLRAKQNALDADIRAAGRFQESLLPREKLFTRHIDLAWKFEPCASVGGDILNFFPLDGTHMAAYVLDVSGHGVPAAFMAISIYQMLLPHTGIIIQPETGRIASPGDVLRMLDASFPFERFNKFFTIFYMVLDIASNLLTYSSAGHPPPILIRRDGSHSFMDRGGTIIGLGEQVPFEEETIELHPQDSVYVYTDGVVEYSAGNDEMYGMERLLHCIGKEHAADVSTVIGRCYDDLMDFGQRTPLQDDLSLLGLKIK